jgi:hypothetical protein
MYFGGDKKLLESANQVVDEIVASLPKAEQSEFHKRVRTYQHCFAQKNKLINDKNWLYKFNQQRIKEIEKTKLIGSVGFFAYLVANWFFNFVSEEKMSMFVAFAIAYIAYLVLSEKINESEFALKIKIYDAEIAQNELEITKIGVFSSMYRYNDMKDYETFSEAIQEKMRFDNECYVTNYRIEILEAMCVTDDISEKAHAKKGE